MPARNRGAIGAAALRVHAPVTLQQVLTHPNEAPDRVFIQLYTLPLYLLWGRRGKWGRGSTQTVEHAKAKSLQCAYGMVR